MTEPRSQLCLESSRARFEGGSSIMMEFLSLEQVATEASGEIFRNIKSYRRKRLMTNDKLHM